MLTVRAKLESPEVSEDPQRLVTRVAEVWGFFWGMLPVSQGFALMALYDERIGMEWRACKIGCCKGVVFAELTKGPSLSEGGGGVVR